MERLRSRQREAVGVPSEARPPAPAGDQPEPRDAKRPDGDATRHCRYLGLRDDPATRALYPSAKHCCFARRRPWPVPHGHQLAFCLGQFERCTIYTAVRSTSNGGAAVQTAASLRQRLRQWLWLSLLITLLVAIGAYAVAHAHVQHQAVPAIVLVCSALALILSLALVAALAARLSAKR